MKRFLLSCILLILSTLANSNPGSYIKIGAIFPITGNIASYGQDNVNAIKLFINQINSNGGIHGKKIHEENLLMP